jgi:hypothetical protein
MTEAHLTDEQLSAHLDAESGIDDDETVAPSLHGHLDGCDQCRRRLAALGAVRSRLAAPVAAVSPEVRAASIASVLRRAGEVVADTGDAAHAGGARRVGGAPPVSGEPRREPVQIPRRRPQALVGAAAAVLVLAAVGVSLALSGQTTSSSSSAAKASAASTAVPNAGKTASGTSAGSSGLGDVSSLGVLRSRLAAVLGTTTAAGSASRPGASPTPTASTPSIAMGSAATGAGTQGLYTVEPGQQTPSQFERCLTSATRRAGPGRTLRFVDVASFRGTPALIYVFGPSSGRAPTGTAAPSAVVATARAGCRVLGTTSVSLGG